MRPDIAEFLAWEAASRDTIDVKRIYIDIAGEDLVSGVLLSQLIYWHLPSKNGTSRTTVHKDGKTWLVKRREDWWDECRISAKQFDRASGQLIELGLIDVQRFRWNGAPTIHIYLNLEKIVERVKSILTFGENGNSPLGKMEIDQREKSYIRTRASERLLTEITSEKENSLQKTSESYDGAGSPNDPSPSLPHNHPDDAMPIEHKRQRLRKPLDDDDWLKALLLEFSEAFPFEAFNDDAWWIAISQPLEGVFNREWLNREFGKIQAYLIEKPRKQPRSPQGWKTFVRGWLQRAYEYQRKYTRG